MFFSKSLTRRPLRKPVKEKAWGASDKPGAPGRSVSLSLFQTTKTRQHKAALSYPSFSAHPGRKDQVKFSVKKAPFPSQ